MSLSPLVASFDDYRNRQNTNVGPKPREHHGGGGRGPGTEGLAVPSPELGSETEEGPYRLFEQYREFGVEAGGGRGSRHGRRSIGVWRKRSVKGKREPTRRSGGAAVWSRDISADLEPPAGDYRESIATLQTELRAMEGRMPPITPSEPS